MIKTSVSVGLGYTLDDVKRAVSAHLPITVDELKNITLLHSSLSLDDKTSPAYKLTVGITLSPDREAGLLKMRKKVSRVPDLTFPPIKSAIPSRPVVVGAGPCGLFAALLLAESGARPIVIERGEAVEERGKSVRKFITEKALSTESNVQFGEGGAGTYSDGKLKVGSLDKYKMKVLTEFCRAGASDEIMHSATAHLGTDKLSLIVKNLRERIKSLGGEFIYSAKLVDYKAVGGTLSSVTYIKDGEEIILPTGNAILAIGHSARDTYEMLLSKGAPMVAKGFGIGMRIEHPREYINELIYGKGYDTRLETASYHLVTHLKNGRSVYSFCMCPGGTVVAATSETSGIVTNGMSEFDRDGRNSNAALLVSVTPDDFADGTPLAGIALQRQIERAAYSLTDSYRAPTVKAIDLVGVKGRVLDTDVTPTYPVGTHTHHPDEYMPKYIAESLTNGLVDFDEWMPGYYVENAVLTGPETRTTAPVRILRGENYALLGMDGVYPAGEGAGYSGGIVSSAVDGLRCAEAMLLKYSL